MREIKFRGKCSQSKRWVYGAFVPDATERTHGDMVTWGFIRRHNIESGRMESIEVDRKSVGQYTGLKDKNGKEIYEGDILKNVRNPLVDKEPFTVYYNVRGGGWCWQDGKGQEDLFFDSIGANSEVVGNIHDNPELMEGGQDDE